METKAERDKVQEIGKQIKYNEMFVVESRGLSGGQVLMWKEKGHARLLSFSKNHIDMEVNIGDSAVWRLTGFYGHPKHLLRHASWDVL